MPSLEGDSAHSEEKQQLLHEDAVDEESAVQRMKEEKEREENLQHVTFTPATVKYIVHPHASSLLSTDDPIVDLPQEAKERAEKVFSNHATEEPAAEAEGKEERGKQIEGTVSYIPRSLIPQMIKECGAFVLAEVGEQAGRDFESALTKIVSEVIAQTCIILVSYSLLCFIFF